ncbi:MAG: OmpA family protein [Alphaproteobacteria bacterium]|nr:OmpA family protein [Alphaproteobacteria bacterium]
MRSILFVSAAALVAASCTTTDPYTGDRVRNNTGTGVLVGAGTGAALGTLAGGSDSRNAVIGAIIGGIAGGAIGGYMDRQEAQLRAQLRESQIEVQRTAQDEILLRMPASITFDFDQAVVKSQFVPTLADVARTLRDYPSTTVDVIGHADSTGADDYNQELSENRAFAVGSVLINNGVQRERLVARGMGETQPIASNATAQGREQNRRVEIRLKAVQA